MIPLSPLYRAGHPRPLQRAIVVALLYFCAGELGHFLSFPDSRFATFWPPNGVLLAALLLSPKRQWSLLILWCAAVNHFSNVVLHHQPSWLSLSFVAINAITVTSTALLVLWSTGQRLQLSKLRHMLLLIGIASFLCPMLGATLGTFALATTYPDIPIQQTWRVWWVADALGAMIVTPPALLCLQRRRHTRLQLSLPRLVEFTLLIATLALMTIYIFHGLTYVLLVERDLQIRFPIILLPAMVWIALRFDLRGVAIANFILAALAIYFTSRGEGPIAAISQSDTVKTIVLQAFIGLTSLISLTLGAGFYERRQSELRLHRLAKRLTEERHALHHQKELLQAILDSISDGVTVADRHGRLVHFNPAAERMLGTQPLDVPFEAWPQCYSVFLTDGETPMPFEQLPMVQVMLEGASSASCDAVIKHAALPEGVAISATARPVRDRQGRVVGGVAVMHDITQRVQADAERQRLIHELQTALREIKTLKGLIPICACCKSVRHDDGYWQKLEAFLVEHTDAELSHGICEDCGEKLYGAAWKQSMSAARVPLPPAPIPLSKTPLRQ